MKKQRLLCAWALLSVAGLQASVSSTVQLNRIIRIVKALSPSGATAAATPATTSAATPATVTASPVFAKTAVTATPAPIVVPAGQTIASLSVGLVWGDGSAMGEPVITLTPSEIATLNQLLGKPGIVAQFEEGNNTNFVIGTIAPYNIKHEYVQGGMHFGDGSGFGISYSLSDAPNTMLSSDNVLTEHSIAITQASTAPSAATPATTPATVTASPVSVATSPATSSLTTPLRRILRLVKSLTTPVTASSPATSATTPATSATTPATTSQVPVIPGSASTITIPAGQSIASMTVYLGQTGQPVETHSLSAAHIQSMNNSLGSLNIAQGKYLSASLLAGYDSTGAFAVEFLVDNIVPNKKPSLIVQSPLSIANATVYYVGYTLSGNPSKELLSNNANISFIDVPGNVGQTITITQTPTWAVPATFAALQSAIPQLSTPTSVVTNATLSAAPNSFNINVGTAGFAFFSNPWFGSDPVVAGLAWSDIASYLSSGLYLVLLGFDANNNLILDFTKQSPVNMKLLIYNKATGALIKSVAFNPMTNGTVLPGHQGSALVVNSNALGFGGMGQIVDPSATYPAVFEVTFPQAVTSAVTPVTVTASPIFAKTAVTATPAPIVIPAGKTIASLSVGLVWGDGSSTGEPISTLTPSEIATLNQLLGKPGIVAQFEEGNNTNFVIGTAAAYNIKHKYVSGGMHFGDGSGFGISYSLSDAPNTMLSSDNVLTGHSIAITQASTPKLGFIGSTGVTVEDSPFGTTLPTASTVPNFSKVVTNSVLPSLVTSTTLNSLYINLQENNSDKWLLVGFTQPALASIPASAWSNGFYLSISQSVSNGYNTTTVALTDATGKTQYAYGTYVSQTNFTKFYYAFNDDVKGPESATSSIDGTVVKFQAPTPTPATAAQLASLNSLITQLQTATTNANNTAIVSRYTAEDMTQPINVFNQQIAALGLTSAQIPADTATALASAQSAAAAAETNINSRQAVSGY